MSESLEMTCRRDPKWAASEIERLRDGPIQALETRISQFQFCINRVAAALGNVCCGGVDSSPADQLADPHSTTRVLCDAIAELKARTELLTTNQGA